MYRRVVLIMLLIAVLRLPTASAAAQSDSQPPTVWGVNNNGSFFKPEQFAVLGQLPLRIVRWGGAFVDMQSTASSLITKTFVQIMHKQNIEPLQQISFFNTTTEEAAQLLYYINVDNKLGMKYWAIGNEPEIFKSFQKKDIDLPTYLKHWREVAEAMLKVDPSITLVGPDVSLQMAPLDKSSEAWQWFDAFMKANGDLIKVATFHFYLIGADRPLDAVLASPDEYAQSLSELRDYLKQTLKRDVPVMLTEVNLNSNPGAGGEKGSDTLFAGLWLAEIFGVSAQQGLAAVMPWTAVTNGTLSLISDANVPRPTYYAIQMFDGYKQPIADAQTSVAGVKAYAATSDNGVIVVLVNRTANDARVDAGTDLSIGSVKLQAHPFTLGAYSMTRLEFDSKGAFFKGITYGQKENGAKSAPNAVQ